MKIQSAYFKIQCPFEIATENNIRLQPRKQGKSN